jgi:hypothetical protein
MDELIIDVEETVKHPKKNHTRHEERRQEANERNEHWAKLTSEQQLAELDARLGKDQGATKQRKKLASSNNS